MATAATKVVEFVFEWEGRDRNGKQVRGETRAFFFMLRNRPLHFVLHFIGLIFSINFTKKL